MCIRDRCGAGSGPWMRRPGNCITITCSRFTGCLLYTSRYTIDAVRAAAALGCRVFVGAGSQAEYGRVEGMLEPATPANPENGYGMAKLCAGIMSRTEAAALGVDHVWARVLSVYGPHDGPATMISGTIRALLAGQCPPLTQGEQKWDYLYSADAAEAFYRMARSGQNGAVYPLSLIHI